MSALRRTGEQPVLSVNDEWSYGVFSAVVMRLNVRILQKSALQKFLCKRESKQIRKQITNMVFRLENGRIHLPVLAARSMLYDGMRTAGVNNGIRHRAY